MKNIAMSHVGEPDKNLMSTALQRRQYLMWNRKEGNYTCMCMCRFVWGILDTNPLFSEVLNKFNFCSKVSSKSETDFEQKENYPSPPPLVCLQ